MTGTSNAVNLTDGLDGLAGLTSASAFLAYGVIAFLQDNLRVKQQPHGSGWSDKEALDETLEGAHTQG